MRRPSDAPRRIVLGGVALASGRHEIVLGSGAGELHARVVVGARRGPRAIVIGGPAVTRAAAEATDPALLAGALVTIERLETALETTAPLPAALTSLFERAAFVLELRQGARGVPSWPHVAADLRDETTARLARAFGLEVVLDALPPRGSAARSAAGLGMPALLYEAGEEGRFDALAVERAVAGTTSLLRARRMLPGRPVRPPFRATVGKPLWLRAETDGWVVPLVAPGDVLAAGQPVAHLHDAAGRSRSSVVCPARAVVLSMTSASHVAEADLLARVARVRASTVAKPAREPTLPADFRRIGWCEWVSLPELGIPRLHAKIDTGARTSALHVRSMRPVGEIGGHPVLELQLPIGRRPTGGKGAVARVVVEEYVTVRDSGGHAERRPVIETTLVLGDLRRKVRVTLTDRGDMLFPMLVGRTAVADHFLVDASGRHLLGD